jgi:hypothetical protein
MQSTNDQEKIEGIKAVLIFVPCYLVVGEKKFAARKISEEYFTLIITAQSFFTIVSILFLCVLDALLTLFLLNQRAYEINPVMAHFLKFGPFVFITSKYLLTIAALICLLMFRDIAVRIIKIRTVSVLYSLPFRVT